jgi:hypothetical protein
LPCRLSEGADARGKGNRSFKRSFKCFVESKLLSKSDRTLAETEQLVEKASLSLAKTAMSVGHKVNNKIER